MQSPWSASRWASRRTPAWMVGTCLLVAIATGAAAAARARSTPDDDWPGEADRLMRELALGADATVAEIGAGRGELTVQMAKRLSQGRVLSTEIDRNRLADIARAVSDAGLHNVTVLQAGGRDSNLPEGCCDGVYMREVYHHFADGPATTATIHRALKAGGRLAIIDYPPRGPVDANCHCIPKTDLIPQVTAQGFDVVADEDRWAGTRYLVVFRKR